MNSGQDRSKISSLFRSFGHQISQKSENPLELVKVVRYWTNDQPFLSELICQLAIAYDSPIPVGQEAVVINELVQQKVIKDWKNNAASAHFKELSANLLAHPRRRSLLNLYLTILQSRKVPFSDSQVQKQLVALGLVKLENTYLKIYNPIYASVFDATWVEKNLPANVQPSVSAPKAAPGGTTSPATRRWSGLALLGLITVAIAHSCLNRPATESVADPVADPTAVPETVASTETEPAPDLLEDAPLSDRELFDRGIDHGTNARWLMMLRDLCSVPESSSYFPLAKEQLENWVEIYPDDIAAALDIFLDEASNGCPAIAAGGSGAGS